MVSVVPQSQMDPRWKDKPLGFDTLTIGKYGCLLTCLAMTAGAYGHSETPDSLNEKMKAVGGFQGALIIPALMPRAVPGMSYRSFVQCRHQPAPLAEIDAYLDAGKPVIVEVDYAPNAGLQNHWVVLYARSGGDYLLRDPWPYPVDGSEITLAGRYGFAGSPAEIIQAVVWIEGARTPIRKQREGLGQAVTASFPVFATADGLAIRSDTLVADYTLIKRVARNTALTVLEADDSALAKIGVLNQWLPVRDPQGIEGFTAAWYASLTRGDGDVPISPPPPPPETLVVKTIAEGVALRSRPEISADTLIKRVAVNAELLVTEPLAQARAKIGVLYEWLQVRDITNTPAWVAAWYVTPASGLTTLGVRDRGAPAPLAYAGLGLPDSEPLVVRAGVEGLALRTLPLITPETLIRRLPIDGELAVLEPFLAAELKIGKLGEWLHVRDVQGVEGYVAAWYTLHRPDPVLMAGQPPRG